MAIDPAVSSFDAPETADLYGVIGTPATEESMAAMGDRLGVGPDRRYGTQGFTDGTYVVDLPRSDDVNCFVFRIPKRMDPSELASPDQAFDIVLPSLEDARTIADSYLSGLRLEPQVTFEGAAVNQTSTLHAPNGESKTANLTIAVTYAAHLQGRKIEGPGATVTVTIGHQGEVVGLEHFAQSVAVAEKVALRTIADGLQDIREGKGLPPRYDHADTFASIRVKDVHLAYYAAPVTFAEPYYKPVFVFSVEGKEGATGQWIVSALKDPEQL